MKPHKRRLSLRTKTGYGAVELGMSAAEVMLVFYLLEFYTKVIGLRAELAGFALALPMLWDAVLDPVMGGISDRTQTRLGKRRPYILLGSILLALGVVVIFSRPDIDTQTGKFLYLLAAYMFVNTSMTIVAVPHAALAGEVSFDRNERTELFGWRLLFRTLGFMVAVLLPGLLVIYFEERLGVSRTLASRWVGIAMLATGLITFLSVRKIDRPIHPRDRLRRTPRGSAAAELRGFLRGLRSVATNRAFLPLLITYVLAYIGRTINTSTAIYYYQVRLGLSEREIHINILGLFTVVICFSIGAWVVISRRYGKKMPAFWGALGLGLTTVVIYPLLPPGQVLPPMLLGSVLGGFLVGSIIIFESLVADIVDYDELKTGVQREGLYFGCWTMMTKFARASALASTGILLRTIGLQEGQFEQTPETARGLASLYGPVVGVCFILAAIAFLLMPLTDAKHERIQRLLRKRSALRARHKLAAAPSQTPIAEPPAEDFEWPHPL